MTLIPNWRSVLARAWSVWCMLGALAVQIITALPEWIPYLGDVIPWWLTIPLLLAGLMLRIIKQRSLPAEPQA
jgi:hypothetical protein